MKLFIDTSNKKLIFGLMDNDIIIDFLMEDTNNDMVKNCLYKLEKFLKGNKKNINDIQHFYITIGPGSFTGVKVALNIVNSITLVNKYVDVSVIDSFKLLQESINEHLIIPFGKSKFYYRKNKRKILTVTKEQLESLPNARDGYAEFSKEKLEKKIKNNEFKLMKNIDDIKIKYLSTF